MMNTNTTGVTMNTNTNNIDVVERLIEFRDRLGSRSDRETLADAANLIDRFRAASEPPSAVFYGAPPDVECLHRPDGVITLTIGTVRLVLPDENSAALVASRIDSCLLDLYIERHGLDPDHDPDAGPTDRTDDLF